MLLSLQRMRSKKRAVSATPTTPPIPPTAKPEPDLSPSSSPVHTVHTSSANNGTVSKDGSDKSLMSQNGKDNGNGDISKATKNGGHVSKDASSETMRSKENLPSNVTKEVQANGVEVTRLAKSPVPSPPTLKSCLKPESRGSSLGRHASLRSSSPATAAKLVNFKQTEDTRARVKCELLPS